MKPKTKTAKSNFDVFLRFFNSIIKTAKCVKCTSVTMLTAEWSGEACGDAKVRLLMLCTTTLQVGQGCAQVQHAYSGTCCLGYSYSTWTFLFKVYTLYILLITLKYIINKYLYTSDHWCIWQFKTVLQKEIKSVETCPYTVKVEYATPKNIEL